MIKVDSDGTTGNNVDFPASSPHIIACGGTEITSMTSNMITNEVVWNDGSLSAATGGGIYKYLDYPTYQMIPIIKYTLTSSSLSSTFKFRGVPDIALNAGSIVSYKILQME